MTDKVIEQELKEVHEDLAAIKAKSPDMMLVISGVIKGIRLTTEAAASAQRPPKVTA